MSQTFGYWQIAPFSFNNFLFSPGFNSFGKCNQPFGRIWSTVKNNILNEFKQYWVDLIIDLQNTCIHYCHIQSCLNSMIKESSVHGFAHCIITPERERQIADTTTNFCIRQILFDPLNSFQEVNCIIVVFLNACGYGQYIGIEYNIFRVKILYSIQIYCL